MATAAAPAMSTFSSTSPSVEQEKESVDAENVPFSANENNEQGAANTSAKMGALHHVEKKVEEKDGDIDALEVSSFEGDEDEEEMTTRSSSEGKAWQSPAPTPEKVDKDDNYDEENEDDDDKHSEFDDESDGNDSSWSEDDAEGRTYTRKSSSTRGRRRGVAQKLKLMSGPLLRSFDETKIEDITTKEVAASQLPAWAYLIVGDISNKRTWHLPCRDAEGRISTKLLKKARQLLMKGRPDKISGSYFTTTRVERMRMRRLSRHVWPGLPELKVHVSLKMDLSEDDSPAKPKSELHYLQKIHALANPEDQSDQTRRVTTKLMREDTKALLEEYGSKAAGEDAEDAADDAETERMAEMKKTADVVEKIRARRLRLTASSSLPEMGSDKVAKTKGSSPAKPNNMPRLTSDSAVVLGRQRQDTSSALLVVADSKCMGSSKAAIRARKLSMHRQLAVRNRARGLKKRAENATAKKRRERHREELMEKARLAKANELARELGYKDAAEQLRITSEEANAQMADDAKRTMEELKDRMDEEREMIEAEKQADSSPAGYADASSDEEDFLDIDLASALKAAEAESEEAESAHVGAADEDADAQAEADPVQKNAGDSVQSSSRTYSRKRKLDRGEDVPGDENETSDDKNDNIDEEASESPAKRTKLALAENAEGSKSAADGDEEEEFEGTNEEEEEENLREKEIEATIARLKENRENAKKPRKDKTDIKVDVKKSKMWLSMMQEEHRKANEAKKRKRAGGAEAALFEDEAEEESDDDGGVGNYGNEAGMYGENGKRRGEDDETDGLRITKEDLAGVVDTLSDDEGEDNGAQLHATLAMADDAVQLGKLARAVRKHKFRRRKAKLRSGFAGLEDFMDDDSDDEFTEEEVDEEELYLERLREMEEENKKKLDALNAAGDQDDAAKARAEEERKEIEESNRVVQRALMQNALRAYKKENGNVQRFDDDSMALLDRVVCSNVTNSQELEAVDEREATTNGAAIVEKASAQDASESTGGLASAVVSSFSHIKRSSKTLAKRGRGSFLSLHRASSSGSSTARTNKKGGAARLAKKFVFTNVGDSNAEFTNDYSRTALGNESRSVAFAANSGGSLSKMPANAKSMSSFSAAGSRLSASGGGFLLGALGSSSRCQGMKR